MSAIEQHDLEWHDRLQDIVDGDASGHEREAIEEHVGGCPRCRVQLARLQQLDAQLKSRLRAHDVSPSFDRELFARIEALNEASRARARRRVEQELQDNLQSLAREWRRSLIYTIGGVIAGIALALAFLSWLDTSGLVAAAAGEAAAKTGTSDLQLWQLLMTALIGAIIGGGISMWLAASAE